MIITPIIIDNKVMKADNQLVLEYHDDRNFQLFETERGCYVYKKETEQIYQLPLENFNKLLIKLATLLPPPIIIRKDRFKWN